VVHGAAIRCDHHIGVVERAGDGVALGIAHAQVDAESGSSVPELLHLGAVGQQGVVVVLLPVLAAVGPAAAHGEAEGHAVGVTGEEQFGKNNELCGVGGGFVHETQGLFQRAGLVEHDGGGLHDGGAAGVFQLSHGGILL